MNKILTILFILTFCSQLIAGLPPTSSKVNGESAYKPTFKFEFPNITGTRTGTTISLGVSNIAGGGTNNGSLAVTAGGVLYTDGSKLMNVGAGTSGNIIKSNGSSAPTWVTLKSLTGSITSNSTNALNAEGANITVGASCAVSSTQGSNWLTTGGTCATSGSTFTFSTAYSSSPICTGSTNSGTSIICATYSITTSGFSAYCYDRSDGSTVAGTMYVICLGTP